MPPDNTEIEQPHDDLRHGVENFLLPLAIAVWAGAILGLVWGLIT